MKKCLMFLMILVLLAALTPLSLAEEETEWLSSGPWSYQILPDGTAKICAHKEEKVTYLFVPQTLDGILVTSVGSHAFKAVKGLKEVILPEGLTTIGNRAFGLSRGIERITLPSTLTTIEDYAFQDCDKLKEITIPDGVTNFGGNPFIGCQELTAINFSENHPILQMKDGVIFSKDGKRLLCFPCALPAASYTVPEGTEVIGDGAFMDCWNLTEVTLPATVTALEHWAFHACSSMEQLRFAEGLQVIGAEALSGTAAASFVLPDGVTTLEDGAFNGSFELKEINLPDSLTTVGENPFQRCDLLTDIRISPDHSVLEMKDSVLFSRTDHRLISYPTGAEAESYTVPEGTEIIGANAFSDHEFLYSVTFPEGLKEVGYGAFSSCKGLTEIILPDSIETLGEYSFAFLPGLKKASIPATLTNIDPKAFAYSGSRDFEPTVR